MREAIGDILADISRIMSSYAEPETLGMFLYAEAGYNWVGPSLYNELPNKVVYVDYGDDLGDRILDLWNAADPDKKWSALFCTVSGTEFDARFQYPDPDEWDPEESDHERRPRVLDAKYGDKPIVYPNYGAPD